MNHVLILVLLRFSCRGQDMSIDENENTELEGSVWILAYVMFIGFFSCCMCDFWSCIQDHEDSSRLVNSIILHPHCLLTFGCFNFIQEKFWVDLLVSFICICCTYLSFLDQHPSNYWNGWWNWWLCCQIVQCLELPLY
jgi:membrane protein CcdC involved in cytochrome C biogenesis